MDQTAINHLQQVVCFSLEEISLWGARKKLRPEDLRLTSGDELPPKDLASLGSKKIFNPKILSKFDALKKQAHTACSRVGVRFMGGYAVPESVADDLATELDKIGVEFETVKRNFVATYAAELEAWTLKHPGWEQVIRNSAISVGEVEGRIRYGWVPAKITTPDEKNPNSRLHQKMVKEAGGLAGSLFRECAEMGEKVGDSLLGKLKVNRRALSPIRKIRAKLGGLAFLDKRVTPLITLIDQTLEQMPGDAPIEGLELTALNGLVMTLSSIDRMKDYGQAVLDGNPVQPSWGVTRAVATKAVQADAPTTTPVVAGEMKNLFADEPPLETVVESVQETAPQPAIVPVAQPAEERDETPKPEVTATAEPVSEPAPMAAPEVPMVRVIEVAKAPTQAEAVPMAAVMQQQRQQRPVRRVTF